MLILFRCCCYGILFNILNRAAVFIDHLIPCGGYLISSAYSAGPGGSFGCALRLETRRSGVQPPPRSATFFRGDYHEIFSTVILSLPLIQEGQLSVSGERMCIILVNRLED